MISVKKCKPISDDRLNLWQTSLKLQLEKLKNSKKRQMVFHDEPHLAKPN